MSPTPVTYTLPTMPASYAWEATDEAVSARYGVPRERIVRFDLNSSPMPPAIAARVMATGRFQTPLSDYPPGDYGELTAAAAATYGVAAEELVVGAGADEILDLCAKAFLPPGGVAVTAGPTYAMYRVVTEQRPARLLTIARHGADRAWTLDAAGIRAAFRSEGSGATLLWLCDPNNPTGTAETPGTIEVSSSTSRPTPMPTTDSRRWSSSTRHTRSSPATSSTGSERGIRTS